MLGGSMRRASASAIGERTAFMPHMNRIERGSLADLVRFHRLSPASAARRPA